MSHRIGADIGGTFTDLVLVDDAGALVRVAKVLTTPEHPDEAVYVFRPEDGSIPKAWLGLCHRFVHIPATTA